MVFFIQFVKLLHHLFFIYFLSFFFDSLTLDPVVLLEVSPLNHVLLGDCFMLLLELRLCMYLGCLNLWWVLLGLSVCYWRNSDFKGAGIIEICLDVGILWNRIRLGRDSCSLEWDLIRHSLWNHPLPLRKLCMLNISVWRYLPILFISLTIIWVSSNNWLSCKIRRAWIWSCAVYWLLIWRKCLVMGIISNWTILNSDISISEFITWKSWVIIMDRLVTMDRLVIMDRLIIMYRVAHQCTWNRTRRS